MDYGALAKKFGGTEASDQTDYGALASQYGGSPANAPLSPAVSPTDAIPGVRSSIVPPAAQAVLSAPRRAAESVGGFALETGQNIPQSFVDFYTRLGESIKELVTDPVGVAGNVADLAAGTMRYGAKKVLPEAVFNAIDKLDSPEVTKRIVETASAVGGPMAERWLTSPEATLNAIKKDPFQILEDVSLAFGGAGAGAKLAGAGAIAKPLLAVSKVTDPLALQLTAASKATNAMLGPGYSAVNKMVDPQYRMLEPVLEGRADAFTQALSDVSKREALPGAPRLAGEILAAEGVAGTQYPALEQKLTQKFAPTALQEMEDARRAARTTMLREIAKTPAVVEDAIKARDAATKPLYNKIDTTLVNVDDTLVKIMQRPAVADAVARVKEIARNKDEPFMLGETKPAQIVPSRVLGPDGQPVMVEIPATQARMTGNDLMRIKNQLDAAVAPLPSDAKPAEKTARTGAIAARKDFLAWLDKNIPEFSEVNKLYGELSKPINVMEVGQTLLDALEAPLTGEATRAGVFANAVRNAQQTLKKATGEARFEKLTDILPPEDAAKVQRVLKDLQSAERYKELGRAGRAGISDITGADIPAPSGLLDRFATIATRVIDAVEGRMNRSTAMAIAAAAQDPALMAQMIERVATKEQRLGAREASVRATTEKITNAMRGKAPVLNVLAQPQEEQ